MPRPLHSYRGFGLFAPETVLRWLLWGLVLLLAVAAPAVASLGKVVDVEVRVANVGNAQAGGTVVRFFDGAPAFGALLGEVAVESLAAGAETRVVFPWDSFDASGLRLIHAVVDPDRTLLDLGVDGLFTNLPDRMRAILHEDS